nr:MAG TPA: tail protein [Caudoviricetes sp.]
MASGGFPGNGNYRLDLSTWTGGTTIYASISVTKTGGSGYWTSDAQWWRIRIAGADQDGWWTYDFRGSTTIGIATRSRGVGYGSFLVEAWVNMDSGFGQAYAAEWVNIFTTPGAPNPIGLDQATITSLRYRFSGTTDGGTPVREWQAQIASNGAFTQNVQTVGSNGTTVFSGLSGGTTYYARSRGRNDVGWGAWSSTISATTLPSGPPGITVSPSADGMAADVRLSPPGNATGVQEYQIDYRETGASSVTTISTTSPTKRVPGLTPGGSYDWRARARFGTYWSPYSTWQTVVQTKPTPDPTAYFDGSLPGRGNRIFEWAGIEHGSVSRAYTAKPVGWTATTSGGGAVSLGQVVGGRDRTFAARALVTADATGPGVSLGLDPATAYSTIIADAPYAASMYVRPSRSQRIAAVIYWYSASGSPLGSQAGGAVVAPTGEWTRLSVSGGSPVGAARAVVRVVDVAGTGWSAWKTGEFFDADAAMISLRRLYDYFDGSFLGTPEFSYNWEGAPDASVSVREYDPEDVFVLLDPDCEAVPSSPRPPAIVNDCVTIVGQWRRFWYAIPASEVGEWSETLPTIRITTATADVGQVRLRFYRNPDGLPIEEYDATRWDAELILSYAPPAATITLDGISQSAKADVAGRTGVSADHLLYGSNGGVVTWPVLSCGDAYLMSWDIPISVPSGNVSMNLELTQRV